MYIQVVHSVYIYVTYAVDISKNQPTVLCMWRVFSNVHVQSLSAQYASCSH